MSAFRPAFRHSAFIALANALIFSTKIQGQELTAEQKTAELDEAMQVLSSDLIDTSRAAILDAMVRIHVQAGNQERAADLARILYESGYRHPDFMTSVGKSL